MYAKQLAWLHAAPKKHDKDEYPISRFKSLDDDDPLKQLPEIGEYYATCFQLSGMFLSGGMSIIPLTWVEIDSFISRSAYPLNGFEAENLINMSRGYCNFSNKAKDNSCQSPMLREIFGDEELMQQMRDKVSRQWEAMEKAPND